MALSFRAYIISAALALGVLPLAACDNPRWLDQITGEGREEQMVPGPRRAPVFNPQAQQPPRPARPMPPPPAMRAPDVRAEVPPPVRPAPSAHEIRKPFLGDPADIAAPATSPPPPVAEAAMEPLPPPSPPAEAQAQPPVGGSWFDRNITGTAGITPALSSVPPTPPAFEEIKRDHDRQLEDLQQARMEAEAQKKLATEEPPPPKPAAKKPKPKPKTEATPAVKPVPPKKELPKVRLPSSSRLDDDIDKLLLPPMSTPDILPPASKL